MFAAISTLSQERYRPWLAAALLWLALFGVYAGLVDHDFQAFDDGLYVTDNSYVQDGVTWEGVVWAFSNVDVSNWHPLTWLSHMVDVSVFGPRPAGHYAMNVIYQGLAAMSLFYFLRQTRIGFWLAFLATLVWAIHPSNVESVAWIGQRKTLVCGIFFFLCLGLYLKWQQDRRFSIYGLSLICALLALMAKPSAVVLPILLLALDVWPGLRVDWDAFRRGSWIRAFGQVVRLGWEKVPYFFVSVLASWVTFFAQDDSGATGMTYRIPLFQRLLTCFESLWEYLGKSFGSAETSLLYALRDPVRLQVIGGVILVGLLLVLAWILRRSQPWVLACVGIFFGAFLPVIGLVQVGSQRMADRYLYFSLVGMVLLTVLFSRALIRRDRAMTRPVILAFSVWVGMLVLQARGHVGLWSDKVSLFRNAEMVGGASYAMRLNTGVSLMEAGDAEGARAVYRTIIGTEGARLNLAMLDFAEGKMDAGIEKLRGLVKHKRMRLGANYVLGFALARQGRYEEARRCLLIARSQLPVSRSYVKKVEDIRSTLPIVLAEVESQLGKPGAEGSKLAQQPLPALTSATLAQAK